MVQQTAKNEQKSKAPTIHPVGDRILAQRQEKETMRGGIMIPDSAKKKSETMVVRAVGPGKTMADGKLSPMVVKAGDVILANKYAGQEVEIDGEEYLILRLEDVVARID